MRQTSANPLLPLGSCPFTCLLPSEAKQSANKALKEEKGGKDKGRAEKREEGGEGRKKIRDEQMRWERG